MPAWRRTFWAVWTANFIAATGMQSFLPFFPSHLESLGLTDRDEISAWTGVLVGAAPLSAACMGPVWGVVGDRVGRKLMVLRALSALALFVGLMSTAGSPVTLLFLRIGQGIFSGFIPPSTTLVSVSVPAERQGSVAGSLQTALSLGMICGPMLGGLLASWLSPKSVFLVVSGAAAVSALLVLALATEVDGLRRGAGEPFTVGWLARNVFGDLAGMLRSAELRGVLIVLFVVQFGIATSNPLLELFVRDLGTGESDLLGTGVLFSALAVAAAVTGPLWGRWGDRIGHGKAMSVCALASGLTLGLHAVVPTYAVLFAVRVLLGATASGVGPISTGIAATRIPPERRGAAFGALFSARAFALALGASLGGLLAVPLGIRGLFVFGASLVLLGQLLGRRRA